MARKEMIEIELGWVPERSSQQSIRAAMEPFRDGDRLRTKAGRNLTSRGYISRGCSIWRVILGK